VDGRSVQSLQITMSSRALQNVRGFRRFGYFGRVCGLAGILVCAVLSPISLASAEPPAAYSQRVWKTQDGLPEQVVQAFAQTADHYLWIGTTGGLVRFDGERFVVFDRENTPAFVDNNVFCLTVTRDNTLWIGLEGGGLISYREGVFRAFGPSNGLNNTFVRAVHEDRAGALWVGTDDGLFLLRSEHFNRVDTGNGNPRIAVHALYEDRRGGLWVGGSRLLRGDGKSFTEYRLEGEATRNRVKSILETTDGAVWVGTVSGLQKLAASGSQFQQLPEISGTVRFLRETSDHTLWIGMIGRGLQIYRNGEFRRPATVVLPSNTLLNLFEDTERNIWIGTQAGMVRLSKSVRTLSLPDAADSDAETIYQDRNADIWVAGVNLIRIHNGRAQPYPIAALAGVRVRNVFRDRDGALWLGTEGRGIYREAGGRLIHYSTENGLANNFVRAILQARDGSVWIGTDEGVSRWRPAGLTSYTMNDGLCYFSTRSLLEAHNGDIWIGTDRGVSHIHDDKFVADLVTKALKDEKVWAMHEDPDGAMWFGTRTGGLYRWQSGKLTHLTTAQGLASNGVYELLEDPNGILWMSGPQGISAVSRKELSAVADDPSRFAAVTLYGVSEGMETIQMCGGEKPAGILTTEGEVWFPSSKGPVRIPITQPAPSEPPPVLIDRVMADGRQVPLSGPVVLDPSNAKLEVGFSAVRLRSQERLRFRYMLEGVDREWNDASNVRTAYYTNLSPGRHWFRVVAFEMNNPKQMTEASLEFVQQPHFYSTKWFIGLCLLLTLTVAWAVYRLRVGQLRTRFAAVLKERNRLAREMHDTIIQGCVGVSALLEAHSSLNDSRALDRSELLDYARTQLRSTIDEARQAVWNLRQSAATEIASQLEKMAEQISHESDVTVQCQISGRSVEFDQATAHDVLMVIREALYNAVRHGHPHRVSVNALFEENRCTVKVFDDGSGFDPVAVSSMPDGHYGLVGIRERVERVGGKFTVNSRVGSGTELIIEVPRSAGTDIKEDSEMKL
jgi:ligand-binding sensor domain-containing protein/signal transduction histidine kinase